MRPTPAPSTLTVALFLLAASSCTGPDPDPDAPYREVALEPTATFLARQAEYLDYCHAHHGPGQGGLYGQLCRVARGDGIHTEAIDAAIAKVEAREDTADFTLAALIRMLYLDDASPSLDASVRLRIEQTVVEAKYWLDEPGDDRMCYWSENHQALFHSNELLAGQLFPDAVFPNSGMTGREHVRHAERLAERWLELRGRFGFSEWHSNVYFNEDIPALVNLADHAEDPVIRSKAAAVLDLVAFDLLNNTYRGYFATVHGRTYESRFVEGLDDSTAEAAWIMVGLGSYASAGNFSGTFLATSDRYTTPGLLEDIAADVQTSHEHRQRDGIDILDGPLWGIGYEEQDDIVFWAGMSAIAAPEVIEGTASMLDDLDLWDGFLFGDLPPEAHGLIEAARANDTLVELSADLEPISRGIALQSMSTTVYRTPEFQLAGAQDYNPGWWSAQTQMWQATLDGEAFVFTTCPTDFDLGDEGLTFATEWIGGWMPRATFHRTVGVIQYRQPEVPVVGSWFASDRTHAFFPRAGFDEVVQEGAWTFGRKGGGYLALYSDRPTEWASEVELLAPGADNVWIVELGSAAGSGSFEAFVAEVVAAEVSVDMASVDDAVRYDSPSVGRIEVGWEGPMTVAGEPVDLGPYRRWDNEFARESLGAPVTRIDRGEQRLELDFARGRRRLLELDPG